MKKILVLLVLFLSIFTLTGCGNETNKEEAISNSFITVKANEDSQIIIDTSSVSSNVTFDNYKVDDVTIQFIVVRGTDGKVRIAFNTCQACKPSPNAYFKQVGEYLQCQNCGNKFHIDKIGEEKGGCNPTPVEEKEETDNKIIVDQEYVESFKEKFENWNGPIK